MLNKKHIALTLASGLAALFVLATQSAASKSSQGAQKLGGAWVGALPGISWAHTHSPLDPDGKRAAVKIQWVSYDGLLPILASFGADSMSEGVGEVDMIDATTAKYTLIQFLVNTQAGAPQVMGTWVLSGNMTFTDENNAVSFETTAVYSPAKTEANGLPKPGMEPDFKMATGPTPHQRVQIVPPVEVP